jgi:hypothetical protein
MVTLAELRPGTYTAPRCSAGLKPGRDTHGALVGRASEQF